MDCIESAAFPDQSEEEVDRLLHMVVVGGGPTGIEFSGELHDFVVDDLKEWYPELADRLKITLIEALPSVLPTFSKQLISYTESTFKTNKIDILTKTMVKEIKEKSVIVQNEKGERVEMPFGLLVWAAGNKSRKVTQNLMAKLPDTQTNKRGIVVDDFMVMPGTNDLAVDNHTTGAGIAPGTIFALGDCTATSYAPTAQVASQQGLYLGKLLNQAAKRESLENALEGLKEEGGSATEMEKVAKALKKAKLRPFHYSHQGSLAYIGSDKAIADLPFLNGNFASGGVATFLFWRSAYVSTLFSLRNRTLVLADWVKVKLFGRDVSRE
jgi:NADH:ubiquinone reductase (non-electrogenic)